MSLVSAPRVSSLSARAPDAHPGAVVDNSCGTVLLWVVQAGQHQHVFSDLDTAQAYKDDWDHWHLASDEATICSRTFVVSDLYKPTPRRRMIAIEVPSEILIGTIDRCVALQLNPHRLFSGLAYYSLSRPDDSPLKLVASLDIWERGKRRPFKQWTPKAEGQVQA